MVNVVYAVLAALIGLGILIVIHEFGHFLLAKKTGVGVLTFSIGFGPKLLSRKVGETEYALSAFPLGGYVKMVGEDPEEEVQTSDVARSFSHQGLVKRAAIVAAGPVFNLLLAVVVFIWIFVAYGVPVLTTRVGGVEPNSPAARAGVQKGDRIAAVDGQEVKKWEELSGKIKGSEGRTLQVRERERIGKSSSRFNRYRGREGTSSEKSRRPGPSVSPARSPSRKATLSWRWGRPFTRPESIRF